MELVGGGSDINRATPSSFSVSVLLLASVERFGVSRMRDFLNKIVCLHGNVICISVSISMLQVKPVEHTTFNIIRSMKIFLKYAYKQVQGNLINFTSYLGCLHTTY